jgi:CHASE2 domain-containing sensor protein
LGTIGTQFEFLNPLEEAFSDFELTDIMFSQMRSKDDIIADTNVVLVNIGILKRADIAKQIAVLNQYKPAVIGLDAFFRKPQDELGDSLLVQAIREARNVVLVSKLNKYNPARKDYDTLETSHPIFNRFATTGFSNFISDGKANQLHTCRSFSKIETVRGKNEISFPVLVASRYDSKKAANFLSRRNNVEEINFRRDRGYYYNLDWHQVLNPEYDLSFIKGKIVLMGYMGVRFDENYRSYEDKFYTPLNEKYAGKANPDMFGVVAHANIISMILEQKFIEKLPNWLTFVIGLVICYSNVVLFYYIKQKYNTWYDAITKIIQLAETIVIIFLILKIFEDFSIKINLEIGLVAILLSGDLVEFYIGGVENTIRSVKEQIAKSKLKTPKTK